MSDVVPDVGRHAVLVDAGYLYASVGQLVLGRTSRREFRVAAEPLIGALLARADRTMRGELLRMYWYDAARDRVPTVEQRQIASLPNVKVRLGNLNSAGQQKGVDAQLRQDLELLARHRAVTDVVLIAGDEDMVSAVEAAQGYGVRVHVWGVEPPYGVNQAERLIWEADTVGQLDVEFCRPYVELETVPVEEAVEPEPREDRPVVPTPADVFAARKLHASAPKPVQPAPVAPVPPDRSGPERPEMEQIGARIAARWLVTRGRENVADLLPGPVLPTVIDKELLVEAEEEISRSLRPYEEARRALRDGFWAKLHQEFGIHPASVPPHPSPDHQPAAAAHSGPAGTGGPAQGAAAPAAPGAPAAAAQSGGGGRAQPGPPAQSRPAVPAQPAPSGVPSPGQLAPAGSGGPSPTQSASVAPAPSGPAPSVGPAGPAHSASADSARADGESSARSGPAVPAQSGPGSAADSVPAAAGRSGPGAQDGDGSSGPGHPPPAGARPEDLTDPASPHPRADAAGEGQPPAGTAAASGAPARPGPTSTAAHT